MQITAYDFGRIESNGLAYASLLERLIREHGP